MSKFIDQLGNVDWSVVEDLNDPGSAYTAIYKFKEIYNCCFPLKKGKIKRGGINKPYGYLKGF